MLPTGPWWGRTPAPPTPQIQPSLPVKKSVLRQLGIADSELPHGLARLKHSLLLSPSHTPSQESNICANSDFSWRVHLAGSYNGGLENFRERLKDTIAESRSRPDPNETFKSLSYLDQIAIVCLAAGWRDCRAPDCLQYRRKLEIVVPVCRSWPGLRDWVLCIASCSLFTLREPYQSKNDGFNINWDNNLLLRFRNHLTACIVLTWPPEGLRYTDWDITGRVLEADKLLGTHESGSIGGPGPDQTPEPFGRRDVSSRRCPVLPPKRSSTMP